MAEARYRIGTVARLSGLSTHVIRVWERRYQALTPNRSGGGARLYSDAELGRLRLLRRAVDGGHAIGQIATLDDAVLERLGAPQQAPAKALPRLAPANAEFADFAEELLRAVRAFDVTEAERVLERAAITVSPRALIVDLLPRALRRIGDSWADGDLTVASEHMASALIRDRVGGLLREYLPDPHAETIVFTTPAGELHELGALFAAVAASMNGFRAAFLGPNLPASQIAEAARRTRASVVALSLVSLEASLAAREVRGVRRELAADVELLLGGAAAVELAAALDGDAVVHSSLAELEQWLAARRNRLTV